jgi:hypothetical protein
MAHGWLGADWGNVPAWIGSVVTSVSVAVAAISYRRNVAEKISGQASLIAAWISSQMSDDGTVVRSLRVSNGSDTSVYEICIFLSGSDHPHVIPEVPPKSTITPEVTLPPPPPAESGKPAVTTELGITFFGVSMTAKAQDVQLESAPPIEFRDAVGRRWRREPDGKLHRSARRSYMLTSYSVKLPFVGSLSVSREEPPDETQEADTKPAERRKPN